MSGRQRAAAVEVLCPKPGCQATLQPFGFGPFEATVTMQPQRENVAGYVAVDVQCIVPGCGQYTLFVGTGTVGDSVKILIQSKDREVTES